MVTAVLWSAGWVTLNVLLSPAWLKTVLIAGRPIWSTCARWSGCRVMGTKVRTQTPIFGLGAEHPVGNLQRNREDVLVGEEIGSGEFEPVEKPDQVEEEGIAAKSGVRADA